MAWKNAVISFWGEVQQLVGAAGVIARMEKERFT
jgi:hypothetical protein